MEIKVRDFLCLYREGMLHKMKIEVRKGNYGVKDVIYYDINELFKEDFWNEKINNWFIDFQKESLVIDLEDN